MFFAFDFFAELSKDIKMLTFIIVMDPFRYVYARIFHWSTYHAALALMYLAQGIWFAKAWRRSGSARPSSRKLLRWLLAAAGVVLLATGMAPLSMRYFSKSYFPHHGFAYWVLTAARVWMFASFLGLLVLMAVQAALWLAAKGAHAFRGPGIEKSRRKFLRNCVFLAGSAPFLAVAYGFGSRLDFRIRRADIPIAGLPEKLDGLTIVQLSDIHMGDYMPRSQVRRAVAMANRLNADLAVVTGDFITWKGDPLEECISELSRLRAPLGVWGCNGNHERYARAEHEAQELFQLHGMRLLRQQRAELNWRGERLNIIGVDYQSDNYQNGRGTSPYMHMLEGVEPLVRRDMPNLLLSHNPNSFYRASGMGIELSLAGHTHGGQIRIGIDGEELSPALLYTKFVAGKYRLPFGEAREDGTSTYGTDRPGPPADPLLSPFSGPLSAGRSAALYVNRGLGTIWIPVRLEVPPEITLLTLRRTV